MTARAGDTAAETGGGSTSAGSDAAVLAAQALPPGGMWLLATAVEAGPGGIFTVEEIPAEGSCHDGDVLVRVAEGPGILPGLGSGHVQVCAVVGSAMYLVAEWPVIDFADWPELARPTAAWAMGALIDRAEYDPDADQYAPAALRDAAAGMTPGWPVPAGPGRPD
jgi:hypothetical protein